MRVPPISVSRIELSSPDRIEFVVDKEFSDRPEPMFLATTYPNRGVDRLQVRPELLGDLREAEQ